jgi:hypothetical protein
MEADMDPSETEPIETATPEGMGDAPQPGQQRFDRPVRNHPLAYHRGRATVRLARRRGALPRDVYVDPPATTG